MKTFFSLLFSAGCLTSTMAQMPTKPVSAMVSAGESAADKAGKAKLVERLMTEKTYLYSQLIDKCFTYKMSPTCWAKFSDPANDGKSSGYDAANYAALAVMEYAKREGFGDLRLLDESGNKEKGNRPQMDEIINKLRVKFSMVVVAPIDCNQKASELVTRYPYEVMKRVSTDAPAWSPKSGEAHFTVVLSPTATDMSVNISPDGKQFTITGPATTEAYSTPNKIAAGLDRANKNR